jgi:16S rRNA (cytosine1402-N4)-methyltransferase
MPADFTHHPVLLAETLDALDIRADGLYVDATFGRGGHARAILARLGQNGALLALDQDPEAVAEGRVLAAQDPRFHIEHRRFDQLAESARARGWLGRVDGVLFDLGVSSPQLDDPLRGFSFLRDGPLDMRMNPHQGESAAHWLGRAGEREIADVLHAYGEERHARRIARAIVAARREEAIHTTGQLAAIVAKAHPRWEPGKHPATQTFQAIRIFLNQELDALALALPQTLSVLAPGGRLAVISFHSLEDRMVKRFIRDQARGDNLPPGLPVTAAQLHPTLRLLGKAIHAGEDELKENPRARSAVLRAAQRL